MKKLLISNIILLVHLSLLAQHEIDSYWSDLEAVSENIPEDQLFIHTDRNLYFPGDTIFFQSFIQDRVLQKCQTISESLYVLLHNEDNELIDSARFRISSSMAPGYLKIPDSVSTGYFRIIAYTSLMQNYDPQYCYTSWIRIDEPVQNSVYASFSFDKESYNPNDTAELIIRLSDQLGNKLKNEDFVYTLRNNDIPGDYCRAKTNTQGESAIHLIVPESDKNNNVSIEIDLKDKAFSTGKNIPLKTDQIYLRFLPEGGTFCYGIKQRIAFNAVDEDGEQLYITGIVKNSQGDFIDSINSGDLGPGIIDIIPVKGEDYYAEIQDYPDSFFQLPAPSNFLPVLRADYSNQSVIVHVNSPDAATRKDLLVFRKNNRVLASREIDSAFHAFSFDTKDLPQGTASFLILDENLYPVAERMVYLNSDKEVNVNINSPSESYPPGQETEINFSFADTLNTNQAAVFSVAVVDSATAYCHNLLAPNIMECYLYDEQFYNNLPDHIKFRGLTNMNTEDLDILLMTFGWKRFTRESVSEQNRKAEHVYYDMLKVTINDKLTKRISKKLSEHQNKFFLMSPEDGGVFELTRIDNKSSYFLFDSLGQNVKNIMISPAGSVNRYFTSASVKFPGNQEYYQSVASSSVQPLLKSDEEFVLLSDYKIITNRNMFIEEVSITEKRRKASGFVNEFEKEYKNFSTVTLEQEDIEIAFDFESLLRGLHPRKIWTVLTPHGLEKHVALRYTKGFQLDPVLFVVDGFPMGNDYSILEAMHPNSIHSVTALRGTYGFQRYGPKAVGGVIFIETKVKHFGGEYEYEEPVQDRGDLGKVFNLFRPNIEFYIPNGKKISDNPQNWKRPTLYWNPEIVSDGTNPVTIKYPNHLKKGTVLIKVNGMTGDSRPFYGEYRYEIK